MIKLIHGLVLMMFSLMICAEDLGNMTYKMACQNCHAPNLAPAIKAPAAFDEKSWSLRFAHAKQESKDNPRQFKTAMDYLVHNVKMGKGLMYHGGLCKEADVDAQYCSDEAYQQAIEYMSHKKQ